MGRWVPPFPEPPRRPSWRQRLQGLRSWFAWLTPFSYRLPAGRASLLGQTMVLVNEPTEVRRLLVDEVDEHPKHPLTLWVLAPLIGRGVFSVNGDEWQQQRRWIDQALQQASLQKVYPQMQAAAAALMHRLERRLSNAGGDRCDLQNEMTAYTADVIVRTILGEAVAADEAATVFEAFARYQHRTVPALVLRLLGVPGAWLEGYLRHHARPIRLWLAERVDRRLSGASAPRQDLLQVLIDSGAFTAEQLVDQVCVLFLAGHETSAMLLAMAGWLLSHDQACQQAVRDEIDGVLAETHGQPAPADLLRLTTTTAVLNETLRLYPPLPFVIRQSLHGERVAGERCPVGGILTLSPWVIQRHRSRWHDPDAFQPERFLTAEGREAVRDGHLPFGLGPRRCPGAAFAMQEALVLLVVLLRQYRLAPAAGAGPTLVGRLTLRSSTGVVVRLCRRGNDDHKHG
ncbi:MAG: cytochrome P450 [Synechococcus sp.]